MQGGPALTLDMGTVTESVTIGARPINPQLLARSMILPQHYILRLFDVNYFFWSGVLIVAEH
jgi:hypothetical protein